MEMMRDAAKQGGHEETPGFAYMARFEGELRLDRIFG